MRHYWLAVVVVLVLGRASVHAEEQVRLEWKFTEGDTFYLETVSKTKQVLKTMGREINQDGEMATVVAVTVKKKNPNEVVLEYRIESLKYRGVEGGPLDEKFGEKLRGAAFQVTLNDKNEVTKVEGGGDLIKRLAGDDPGQQKMLEATLGEETLKKGAAELFTFLPGKAVEKGAKWERTFGAPLGPFGELNVKGNFTYEGKGTAEGKAAEKVSFTAATTYSPPKKTGTGVPVEVVKGNLTSRGYTGTGYFDAAAGRLVQSQVQLRLDGPLTVSVLGTTTEAVLEQDVTTTTRVLDKNPAAK